MALKNGMYIATIRGKSIAANIYSFFPGDEQWTDVSHRAKRLAKALEEGYIFVPVIVATPERIAALEIVLELISAEDAQAYFHEIETTYGLLYEMKGGSHDGK